jgi:CBS domain-containing protein
VDIVDVMTRDVLSVTPETSVRAAALLMIEKRISGLPVVDDGVVVGVISEADFVAKDSSRTWFSRALLGQEDGMFAGVEKVGGMMSRDVVSIPVSATVQDAARLMTRHNVNRLPVIEHGGMVGIVTRSDLIRAYVHSDEEIAGDVELLVAVLPEPMSKVGVSVEDGIVSLTGVVETSAEARLVARMVAEVEGVAGVDSRLSWQVTTEAADSPWSGFPQEGGVR